MSHSIQPGNTLTLDAPYARRRGEGAKIGRLFGVSAYPVKQGDEGEFELVGVFELAKAWVAFRRGDAIYWDDSALVCTNDAANESNSLIGACVENAVPNQKMVTIRLNGVTLPENSGPPQRPPSAGSAPAGSS
jgi:predicted RecA/RadA family phage recombinase